MNRNRILWGGLGIIAVGVIIYLGFYNSHPDNEKENLSATIGTVSKHQNEQITSEDVVLAGEETADWSDDPVVIEAMASILERATITQRSSAYRDALKRCSDGSHIPSIYLSRKSMANLVWDAPPEVQSAVLNKVAFSEQVAAFQQVEVDIQIAMYGKMQIKEADFRPLALDRKVAAFASLGEGDRAIILGRVSKKDLFSAVAKAKPTIHSEILARADRHEQAKVFMSSTEFHRVEMFKGLPFEEREALMGKVWAKSSNRMLQRATPIEVENLRNGMSDPNAADLFRASSLNDQFVWLGRAVKTSPSDFEMLGKSIKHETLGRLFLEATPEQKVAIFRDQPVEVQNDLYGKMSIKQEAWDGMDLNAKAKALSSLPLERQAALLGAVDMFLKLVGIDGSRKAVSAYQRELVDGLSRTQMAKALRLGASSSEVQQALSRHPEIRNSVFSQNPADVQIRIMGRMVKINPLH